MKRELILREMPLMPDTARSDGPLKLAATDQDPVFAKICTLLVPFNQNKIPLVADTVIMGELEIDSIAIFDLIMDVEDTYEVTFPMEMISEIKTIGELVQTIHSASE